MRIENSFILMPGIGQKTEKKLWKNSVTHWNELPENNVLGNKKTQKALNFLEKAEKNLEVENTPFFQSHLPKNEFWRMYENFKNNICFFDIETTGLDKKKNKVTTMSLHRNGNTKTLVRGDNLTREKLQEEFHKSSLIVSFNGKRFDQPFLEHNYKMNINNPHIDLMYLCRNIGLSGGLKEIEKEIGINRDLEDLDGREAIRLWKKYEKTGKQQYLDKLVKYNEYDAMNLEELAEIVVNRLDQRKFRKHCQ